MNKSFACRLLTLGLLALVTIPGTLSLTAQDVLDRRIDRNVRQLERQALRMENRLNYYTPQTWSQVNPWIQQYNIRPVRPLQRAADAVDRAADVADRAIDAGANVAARARFGFTDPNARLSSDVWFYDHYTYWPSYYIPRSDSTTHYGTAVRYYDDDGDGLYERFSHYRDSNQDGTFDVYDRYDFSSTDSKYEPYSTPNDATRQSISGEINAIKVVKVNDVDFIIVRVDQQSEQSMVIDLGPKDRWNEIRPQVGADIQAFGHIETIGESRVLMADTATISQQEVRIERPLPSLEGTVRDVTKIRVGEVENTLVVIETREGNQVVDLGPAISFKGTINPNERIIVHGVPVRMNEHRVVMANRVNVGGQTHTIVRWE